MLNASQIREFEIETNRLYARTKETRARRDEGRWYKVHSENCAEWHAYNSKHQAISRLDSTENRAAIRRGEREFIEDAILFLEVDPWFMYSGYIKEGLLRALKAAPLTASDKSRLRAILMDVVSAKDRRELKYYWGLLRRVWTPEFEREFVEETQRDGKPWKLAGLLRYLHSNRKFFATSELE
jgi:hypothetical protein